MILHMSVIMLIFATDASNVVKYCLILLGWFGKFAQIYLIRKLNTKTIYVLSKFQNKIVGKINITIELFYDGLAFITN